MSEEFQVSVRGGFSDRMGIKPENTKLQTRDLDKQTRTQLINTMTDIIKTSFCFDYTENRMQPLIKSVYANAYQQEIDYSAYYDEDIFLNHITETIRTAEYDQVLTLIEYICQRLPVPIPSKNPFIRINRLFEREYVGYRFINEMITPITSDKELESISQATEKAPEIVSIHLLKAQKLLSDRIAQDYENSIKESIIAVEAQCQLMTGEKKLGQALKRIEKKGINIDPNLRDAFVKLYAYTNDGNGIRHAGNLEASNATFAEAEFMLIACSAFINYLNCKIAN